MTNATINDTEVARTNELAVALKKEIDEKKIDLNSFIFDKKMISFEKNNEKVRFISCI